MKQFRITPIEMVESFLSNYALMCVLVKRDISIRYRGSIIGVFWSFVHPILMLIVYTLFYIGLYGLPHPSLLLLPYILLPILLIIMGLSWFFSSLSVYIRDIQPIVTIGMTILMFISPIFYPLSALPNQYQSLMKFNPIAPAIEALRTILYSGHAPSFFNYNLYIIFSFCIAYLGFAWFQKTRKGFSDAI